MTSMDDVAALAGVSAATVSRALGGSIHVSPRARERVQRAAEELGYVASSNASGLASGRSKNVGVVIPFLERWYFSTVLEGAQSALLAHGYDVTLYNLRGRGTERRSVFDHFLLRKRVDAVITISLELQPVELSRLLQLHKPIVGVGGPIAGVRTLSVDDVAVGRLAAEHLLSLGHRVIGHIGADAETETDFHVPTYRRNGYESALTAAAITPNPGLFRGADFTIPGGYAAAKQLLGDPAHRPTAIFAASDEMAMGTILAARDLGLDVPRDVSVIGVDDHRLSGFFGLTTVAQYPEEQGRLGAEILVDQLQPGQSILRPVDSALDFDLLVRSSTARPTPR